jgi:hypothetical protein
VEVDGGCDPNLWSKKKNRTTPSVNPPSITNNRKVFSEARPHPRDRRRLGQKKKFTHPHVDPLLSSPAIKNFFRRSAPSTVVLTSGSEKKKLFTPPPPICLSTFATNDRKSFSKANTYPRGRRRLGWEKKKLFTTHHHHHLSIDLHHQRPKKFFQKPILPTRPTTSRSMEKKRKSLRRGWEFFCSGRKSALNERIPGKVEFYCVTLSPLLFWCFLGEGSERPPLSLFRLLDALRQHVLLT